MNVFTITGTLSTTASTKIDHVRRLYLFTLSVTYVQLSPSNKDAPFIHLFHHMTFITFSVNPFRRAILASPFASSLPPPRSKIDC